MVDSKFSSNKIFGDIAPVKEAGKDLDLELQHHLGEPVDPDGFRLNIPKSADEQVDLMGNMDSVLQQSDSNIASSDPRLTTSPEVLGSVAIESIKKPPHPSEIPTTTNTVGLEPYREKFKIDHWLNDYISELVKSGNKKLAKLKWDLGFVESNEQTQEIIKDFYARKDISEEEYKKMLGFLGKEIDDVVPKELVSYVESLVKNGIGPVMTLEALKKENLTKEEALTILTDSFHNLKILSETEYTDALDILGESQDDISKRIKNTPEIYPKQKARTKTSDVGEIEIEKDTIDTITKSIETIKTSLEQARLDYAQAKFNYRKKDRENYAWFKSVRDGLGFASTTSEDLKKVTPKNMEEVTMALESAMTSYIEAKKTKKEELLALPITDEERKNANPYNENLDENVIRSTVFKKRLIDQAEKEWDALQEENSKLGEQDEKFKTLGIMSKKALAGWLKVPLAVRMSVIPILIGTGVGLTAGLGAGALYAGSRLGRGIGGMVGSRVAGSLYDKRTTRLNKETRAENDSQYEDDSLSFAEREARDMDARERELITKRRQKIKKAGVMLASGAGAGILTGLAESGVGSLVKGSGTSDSVMSGYKDETVLDQRDSLNGVNKSDIALAGEPLPDSPQSAPDTLPDSGDANETALETNEETTPPLENTGTNSEAVKATPAAASAVEVVTKASQGESFLPAQVELSSKGFLQDIHNLKAEIMKQYAGKEIPNYIKANIMDKPDMQLAKQFNFYDAKNNLSGMGLKGEHLSFDNAGNLVYERLGGQKDVLLDAQTGKVTEFSGKMFKPEVEPIAKTSIPDAEWAKSNIESGLKFNTPIPENIVDFNKLEGLDMSKGDGISPEQIAASPTHIPLENGTSIDIQNVADQKTILFNTGINSERIAIGREEIFNQKKIFVLEDRYQEGAINRRFREAFTKVFEKSTDTSVISSPDKPLISSDFEGGKVYISYGTVDNPVAVKVLLNGKEIATGFRSVGSNGAYQGVDIKINPGLKGGFLLPDTVYERAFKVAKTLIKTIK